MKKIIMLVVFMLLPAVVLAFNAVEYAEKKPKGLVSLVRAGDSFALATKKFNPEDGVRLPDEVIGFQLAALQDRKKALRAEIAAIDVVITEAQGLP